jgi:transposase
MDPLTEGYKAALHHSEYGGVRQRWLIVYSEAAEARAQRRGAQAVQREHEAEQKALRGLEEREFACRADAMQALEAFETDLTASVLTKCQVLRERHVALSGSGELIETGTVTYAVVGRLAPDPAREAELLKRKSLFIVATNERDDRVLPADELLDTCKGQHAVERGFRFLKDPLFLASSLYLKNEKRIMALLMVMTLCLLVYAALEWRILQGLQENDRTYPDQKGAPSDRPTARWVFQSFVGIHVIYVGAQRLVLNLKKHYETVISVLGPSYEALYVSHPT